MDSKYCPSCGSKNDEFENFIQINEIKKDIKKSNYYELESKKEIEFLEKHSPRNRSRVKEKICLNCGTKNNIDSENCINCGISFESFDNLGHSIMDICPNCGAIAHDGDLFCAECGTKL